MPHDIELAPTVPPQPIPGHDHKDMSLDDKTTAEPHVEVVNNDALRIIELPKQAWVRKYRSVLFQMVIFGLLSFSGPSMDNAISGTGGGGQATPYTANAASTSTYALSAVTALLGGPFISFIGIPWACRIGAFGFPLSTSGYYILAKYRIQWYLIFASALHGITAAFLYVAEATAMICYPEAHRRGLYISVWLCMRNLGALISGGVTLGLNLKGLGKGSITLSTYLVFLVISCLGFPISFLLTKTRKVIRSDGYGVPMIPRLDFKGELTALVEHHKQRRTLIMIPVFFFSYFGDGTWFTYLGVHFSVRSRALSSLLGPLLTIICSLLFGQLLDIKRWSPKRRGVIGYCIWMGLSVAIVVWGLAMFKYFEGKPAGYTVDYRDNPGEFAFAYLPFIIYYVFSYLGANLIYWVLGNFASDVNTNARMGGTFRAWETAGQAVAYGIDSRNGSPWVGMGILAGLTFIAAPCFWMLIRELPTENVAPRVEERQGEEENPRIV